MSFLFDDFEGKKNVKPVHRPLPYVRDTGWRPRRHYPDLSSAKIIGIDCETKDPGFSLNGPGWARGEGHIVGVSVATDNGFKAYYPLRHELGSEDNLPTEEVFGWLRRELGRKNQVKVGANITYDMGWLQHEGVQIEGLAMDVQFAEALLDPGSTVALEALGQKWLGEGKDSSEMYDWIEEAYGGPKTALRGNIYRTPPRLVGYYAESDADLPVRIIQQQWSHLRRWNLIDCFYLECKLIPLMVKMRFAGVQVDLNAAKIADDQMSAEIIRMQAEMKSQLGFTVNVNSGSDLALAFDRLGLEYPSTKAGNPSFTADFLAGMHHPFAQLVTEIKSHKKIQSTFIRGYILEMNSNGKLHCQFNQMRGDEYGAVSGRFSSSDPNLQNIPSRHPLLGPLLRAMFIPDYGHYQWTSFDYKQIEYRFMAHFAVGPGADELRAIFNANPEADYHAVMVDTIHEAAGILIDRRPAKTINFGLLYGMMLKTLAAKMAMTVKEAEPILNAYHLGAPFIKATMEYYDELCYSQGYVETILGRKTWFNEWVPTRGGQGFAPLPRDEAIATYGNNIKLANTHKAINRVLQGSSADQMKSCMLKGFESGLFDTIGVPRLTVHDELNFSQINGSPEMEEGFREMQHLMEHVMELRIPVLADKGVGKNWAEAH